jgi:hypothetical protein
MAESRKKSTPVLAIKFKQQQCIITALWRLRLCETMRQGGRELQVFMLGKTVEVGTTLRRGA